MKRKNLFYTFTTLMLTIAFAAVAVFAWLSEYTTDIIVTLGDAKISVSGWYQKMDVKDEDAPTYPEPLVSINALGEISSQQYVAFKFRVVNENSRDATLSVRFSDFSEYMFTPFQKYYNEKKGGGNLTSDLIMQINTAAELNTAKFMLVISDMWYELTDEAGDPILDDDDEPIKQILSTDSADTEMFLWRYSTGENFVGNPGNVLAGDPVEENISLAEIPVIPLPGKVTLSSTTDKKTYANIYFTLNNKMSNLSLEQYKQWIFGTDNWVGYGQQRCANILGKQWTDLSADDKEIVNSYLDYFYQREINTIINGGAGFTSSSLTLEYFEFIGENIGND